MTCCFSQNMDYTLNPALKRAFPGVSTLLKNGVSLSLFLSGKNESFGSVAKATKGFLQTNKQNLRTQWKSNLQWK